MRLTPTQLSMYALLGVQLPFCKESESLKELIKSGHDDLVDTTGNDFGYDLNAWHTHLCNCKTDVGGYRWSNKHQGFPKEIRAALANPEWLQAVRELTEN